MRKVDVQLNDLFDIVEDESTEEVVSQSAVIESDAENRDEDVNVDYEKSREHYYKLLDKGNDALEHALGIAKQTDHPRAFEVVGQMIDKLTTTNKELLNLHKTKKDISTEKGPTNVTNALYVGSTAELQKMLKGKNAK